MNQGDLEEAKRTFLTCAEIPDENLKDPHAHKSSVTSCLYNLGKLLHEQGQQEASLPKQRECFGAFESFFLHCFSQWLHANLRFNHLS